MAKNTAPSTQEHLPIAGIQDGVVIMNDSSVRAILKVQPINFELKSETEQNAIIYSYQAFLNSLDFPIQIVINSKKLDLERYLMKLDESKKNVASDLLRIQIEDYVSFVRRLISIANIMSKRFYVVIGYSVVGGKASSGLASLASIFSQKASEPMLYQDQFDRYRTEVYNRANIIGAGLSRIGLKVDVLDTQQLIELFYGIYNPDLATEERLTDINTLNTGVISSTDFAPHAAEEPVMAPVQEPLIAPTPVEPPPPLIQASEEGLVDPFAQPEAPATPYQEPPSQPAQ
jgi:hypothetical protein